MPVTVSQGFGSFNPFMKRTVRMPVNPLDRSTIVSTYPNEVFSHNPTLFPGDYLIPAAPEGGFALLVVEPASWFKEMDENQPSLEIPNSSMQVANSIVNDYINGMVGCDMAEKRPGLFFVPGNYDHISIFTYVSPEKKQFKQLLHEANVRQINWYKELVAIADVDWARTNGNPRAISDTSRMAAKKLNLTKSWMQDFQAAQLINCKACGHLVNPAFPVCGNCKTVINAEKAKELGIEFAK